MVAVTQCSSVQQGHHRPAHSVLHSRKQWMTREVLKLPRERNTTLRSGDGAQYSTARAKLKRGIQEAIRTMWNGYLGGAGTTTTW